MTPYSARPQVQCHCGTTHPPVLTFSPDRKRVWWECWSCRHQAPSSAWDGSCGARHQAAVLWDEDNTRIRRGARLPVRVLYPRLNHTTQL